MLPGRRPCRNRLAALALLATLVLLALVGCSRPRHTIVGRIVDGADGRPLAAAELQVGRQRVRADDEGRFTLSVSAGSHEIRVALPGYITQVLTVSVAPEHPEVHADVSLPRRILSGTVVDGLDGTPVADARIRLADSEALSSPDGTFRLEAVRLDALEVSAPGYRPTVLAAEDLERLYGATGEMLGELRVSLEPRVLEGTITSQDGGTPLSDVPVVGPAQSVRTDSSGRYRLAYLEPGDVVTFGGEGHRPQQVVYEGQVNQDVALSPWRVALRVVDADGGGSLGGAAVVVDGQTLSTAGDGTLELAIRPGTPLIVRPDGFDEASLEYAGEETLEVALQPLGVAGQLTDAQTGEPVAGALIQVLTSGAGEPLLVRSGEDGRFALDSVRDVVGVTVKAPGYRRVEVGVDRVWDLQVALEPFELRAVYVPFGLLTVPEKIESILDLVQETGMNGIVLDVKGDRAYIAWDSAHPIAREIGAHPAWNLMDLKGLVEECHRRGLYIVARMVVFKDDLLARGRPEWAIKRPDGSLYIDNEGLAWTDPFLQEVRDYNIALAKEVVALGFDEVQLDYLRFPSDGAGILEMVYSQEATVETRTAAIAEFCAQMYAAISRTPAFLSADLYGLTVWLDPARDMGIGQSLVDIAPHLDYVSPMLYPTTFAPGELKYDYPGNYPHEIVYRSVRAAIERTAAKVRPWLQYYSIGRYDYGLIEFLEQRKGAEDAGACGWMFWNARGNYEPDAFYPDAIEQHPELPTPPPPDDEPAPSPPAS